jgi:hypothetical protein
MAPAEEIKEEEKSSEETEEELEPEEEPWEANPKWRSCSKQRPAWNLKCREICREICRTLQLCRKASIVRRKHSSF